MKRNEKIFFFVLYLSLLIFQLRTTNINLGYKFSAYELDRQIQRMNMYPSELARLGYILETKKEVQLIRKVENNFFYVIDFNTYIPVYIPFILSPLLFMGLFRFVKDRNKYLLIYHFFLFSILTLAVIGPFAKYGPVLIIPYLYSFVFLGSINLFLFIFKKR